MDKTVSYPLVFKRIIDFLLASFFPKTVTLLILAQAESTVRPAASLRHSTTQFVVVSLCCVSLRHDNMKFLVAFFFPLKLLVQSGKKSQRKNKSIQHYRAQRIKRQLFGKYHKMFVSENDRSKWPARREFDWSSPRSGRTLSVDRPLFWALTYSSVLFSLILAILHQLLGSVSWVK